MPKHPRKRQKTANDASDVQNPLSNDASKDDEERRLESLLFGTKYVAASTEFDLRPDNSVSKEMQNLRDTDLFFVDSGEPSQISDLQYGSDSDEEDGEDLGSERSLNDDNSDDDDVLSSDSQSEFDSDDAPNPLKSKKPPAWEDPSDPPLVSIESKRLRKLRDQPSETTLTGRQYESRLRRQYERINPQPAWAKAAKERLRESDDVRIDGLLSSTSALLASRPRKFTLPSGTVSIERLRDANQAVAESGCGEIKSLAFHPSAQVPVLCVGSADRRIRLFNVDGHTSPLLQTLHIPTLPLSQFSINFHPSGSSVLLTGARPFYFVYDLQRGEMRHKAGRGLWGSYDSTTSVATRKRGRRRGTDGQSQGARGNAEGMEISSFNPSGDMLAVAGRGGNVHLLDWKSGAGQVVGSLKCGTTVNALWWTGADADGGHLAALTNDSEVFLWDVGERRCVRRWKDEGGFRGAARAMSGSSKGWMAIGSNTGLVNIYGSDALENTSFASQPKPVKTLGHLTTSISTLRFNHDAQIMAMASKEKKDAFRLIHLPSHTAFSNWPTSSTPSGHVSAIDFSAQSEYVAVGNTRGKVLLYHLLDYGAARVFV
ncbi:Methyltransf-2 domain-containing protein [Favolaschia claudopus]|uniref:Methyltransf-2 domain-containing protein n=1 Tax=Favolaschia claudopus TaxID=2862362 RepID=A0AAW0BZR0_9AGAR